MESLSDYLTLPPEVLCHILKSVTDANIIIKLLTQTSKYVASLTSNCVEVIKGNLPFPLLIQLKNLVILSTKYPLNSFDQLLMIAKLPKLQSAHFFISTVDSIDLALHFFKIFLELSYNKYRIFKTLNITTSLSYKPDLHITFSIIDGLPSVTTNNINFCLPAPQMIMLLSIYYNLYNTKLFDLRNVYPVCKSYNLLVLFIMNSVTINAVKVYKNIDSLQINFLNQVLPKIKYIYYNSTKPIDVSLLQSNESLHLLQIPIYIEDLPELLRKYPNIKVITIINQHKLSDEPLSINDISILRDYKSLHINILK